MKRKYKIRMGVAMVLMIVSVSLFSFFSNLEKPLEKPDALKSETELDSRVELTDEEFAENLKVQLISIQEVPHKTYEFPTEKFVVGASPVNTVLTLSTDGVVGLSSYIEKVILFRKESPIPTDYMGYEKSDGNLILLLGTEGKLDTKDLFIHFTVQSMNSKEKREVIKPLPIEESLLPTTKKVQVGDIFSPQEGSYFMKLTKKTKTAKTEEGFSRKFRFLSFGKEDAIDFSKFSLINRFDKEKIPNIKIKASYQKGGSQIAYTGQANIPMVKTFEIEVLGRDPIAAEEIFDNSELFYEDIRIFLIK